jgi:hypothetical protein
MPMLAADLARALDPVLLAEAAGLQPDPWQRDVLRSAAPRVWLNCTRQAGKSTMTALLALHTAIYQPGSLVLLLSRAQRQSQELFRKCLVVYHAAGQAADPDAETLLRLELANGRRVLA